MTCNYLDVVRPLDKDDCLEAYYDMVDAPVDDDAGMAIAIEDDADIGAAIDVNFDIDSFV